MLNPFRAAIGAALVALAALLTAPAAQEPQDAAKPKSPPPLTGKTPVVLPKIPPPDPRAVTVPAGFTLTVLYAGLTYPTSLEFDDRGVMYVAEAGYNYGDEVAPARVLRLIPTPQGVRPEVVADQLNGPVTDIMWHAGKLYISHRGKISVVEGPGKVRDLVTGLPSLGDHHNNGLAAGPDGKIYFGQGTYTNSGVVGVDNFMFGWLKKYPDHHDVSARDLKLRGQTFETPDPIALLTTKQQRTVRTGAFQPFGKAAGDVRPAAAAEGGDVVKGQPKANGVVFRMDPDGSKLEIYAWGLRNPFGLGFTPDGKLLCTDAGYDERGSRPIANAPDCLWQIKSGAWYGFPDFVAGEPVTDPKFRPKNGPAPEFLLAEHPKVEKPLATLPPHTGGAKFDLSRSPAWGEGQAYMGLIGDMTPATGAPSEHPGFAVVRMDLKTLEVKPVLKTKPEALGPKGFEYCATAGLKRPVDVKFSPDGNHLFIVDVGAMAVVPTAVGAAPRPFPATGVIWRLSPAR